MVSSILPSTATKNHPWKKKNVFKAGLFDKPMEEAQLLGFQTAACITNQKLSLLTLEFPSDQESLGGSDHAYQVGCQGYT